MIELIHKDKIRADDYISGFLILSYILFALFFRLELIMSLIVYPFISLFFYGIAKIINGINKRNRGNNRNPNRVLFGIISITFSIAFLNFFMAQPNVTFQNIINLAAYPVLIVGFASIIKGKFINAYSRKYRDINIGIGMISMIVCLLALFSSRILPSDFNILHAYSLSITLVVNILSRAALYLSEYNLSLLRNFKLFFYIISDYFIYINNEGNIVLSKLS
ncbi:MAG: hypothetical protein KGD65_04920 [Candidatus Lokiarchaeota archaeon]|nr:hypothetical protein [Candidatus Lokiarchaeota archaeon]